MSLMLPWHGFTLPGVRMMVCGLPEIELPPTLISSFVSPAIVIRSNRTPSADQAGSFKRHHSCVSSERVGGIEVCIRVQRIGG